MLVVGAGRHAKDLLNILMEQANVAEYLFFDDTKKAPKAFMNRFLVLNSIEDVKTYFLAGSPNFVLGLGSPKNRKMLAEKLSNIGGNMQSVISITAMIGENDVFLGEGLNVMAFSFISNSVNVGKGTLINAYSSIHHDVVIGEFVELSPRSTILGGAKIGNLTFLGAGTIILPNIIIGDGCVIGAGSVVTKDIPSNTMAYGVPARHIRYIG